MSRLVSLGPIFATALAISPMLADAAEDTLDVYWPLHAPRRSWSLIASSERDLPGPRKTMTVTNQQSNATQLDMWFSDKAGQELDSSDVERYEYCSNPGGHPWLFLKSYINAKNGELGRIHPVESTRILFTPSGEEAIDLIANGTYARCGSKGQPYLFWNQNLNSYRIQVWGFLTENPKFKWYWEATVTRPAPVVNDCLKPALTVKAIKVQEAWWSTFKVSDGTWALGSGDIGGDGLPTGNHVKYGRTVWHAAGQLPYYLIGSPDGAAHQCTRTVPVAANGSRRK